VAETVLETIALAGIRNPLLRVVAGRGNNGGDAFVAARRLQEEGLRPAVWLAAERDRITGDARMHFDRMCEAGVPVRTITDAQEWDGLSLLDDRAGLVIDGLLGTGAHGVPREPFAAAIRYINRLGGRARVVAIDIPSGMNGDTGETAGEVVRADCTVTMALPKKGMLAPGASAFTGPLRVVDIGIPPDFVDALGHPESPVFIAPSDLAPLFPRRQFDAHKGTFGHVLIMGGARGYTGAVTMAARSALRAGAGLVTVAVPHSIVQLVAVNVPEAMVTGVEETDEGSIAQDMWNRWRGRMQEFDALLAGPGMTRHRETFGLLRQMLRENSVPMVVDADGISVFAGQPHWFAKARCPVILTPHPGELARLTGCETPAVQADRQAAVMTAADEIEGTVILKGAGTLVAAPGHPLALNLAGNPGMASAGTGDVLAGITVALLAKGLRAYDTACAAVYLHARAGDRGALRGSQAGLIAGDLVEELPLVFREIGAR
jgi:NAD(P)H-hydrate epimerase